MFCIEIGEKWVWLLLCFLNAMFPPYTMGFAIYCISLTGAIFFLLQIFYIDKTSFFSLNCYACRQWVSSHPCQSTQLNLIIGISSRSLTDSVKPFKTYQHPTIFSQPVIPYSTFPNLSKFSNLKSSKCNQTY